MESDMLIRRALECGADNVEIIAQKQIVLSAEFREICRQNTCGGFGRCWMCPPFIGEIDVLMNEVRRFSSALIYQSISAFEDSFDIEGMEAAARRHTQLSQRIEKALEGAFSADHLHLSRGGCGLCLRCAKLDDEPCRFPEKAMGSLEAYGVDVYQTSLKTGMKYVNGSNTVTYFGIILF